MRLPNSVQRTWLMKIKPPEVYVSSSTYVDTYMASLKGIAPKVKWLTNNHISLITKVMITHDTSSIHLTHWPPEQG